MAETSIFCLAFLSQVLFVSWYYPRRALRNRRYVLENFPPSTHPKLYPQPLEYYERRLRNFARLNAAIVVAGIAIIVSLMLAALLGEWDWGIFEPSRNQHWNTAIVAPYFVVQILAIVYLDLSIAHNLAMASAPPPRVRTAELQRRRLTDFVSPTMLVVAALTNLAFIGFVLYYHRLGFAWFKAAGLIITVAGMALLLFATIAITLYSPRPDPYQANRDRRNSIKRMVQQALVVCIAIPVLIAIHLIIKHFAADFLQPVITSLYCQGVALAVFWPIPCHRPSNVDFDVYKRDARDSPPDASARISST